MIEGLKIELTTDQIWEHLKERQAHHEDRANWYRSRVEELDKGLKDEPNVTNNPVLSMRASLRQHTDRAAYFFVLSEHLIANETYRLDESDLARLEFMSRYL